MISRFFEIINICLVQSNLVFTFAISLKFIYIDACSELFLEEAHHSFLHCKLDGIFEPRKPSLLYFLLVLESAFEVAISFYVLVWISWVLEGPFSWHCI
jgi:hypothetical protein